ncbi:GntR family transcriptional regulator [Desulforhopalus singaporensis]|uniref:DNA-binding transcriptional regulator, GntR family n=1 Tax=Desulforhopalus singaporensis TaxID=91360 RepID=A0A1H0VBE7_9BACT|nr:GntR family transcriptional regulator [Desulforhopalus singaporensis]SDP75750.1 DNA-binding transcriptional regulator, GntR family [Desulforhopalus singaporensis]
MRLSELTKPDSLTKIAYDAIYGCILSGQLTVDVVYKEKNIAENLGISRTPVREALLGLSSQGLITLLPRKGLVVNKFTRQGVEEVFELREAIEVATIKKICQNNALSDFSHLGHCLRQHKESLNSYSDLISFMNFDREFHVALCQLAGNGLIVDIMSSIRDKIHLIGMQALSMEGRMYDVIQEHEKIVEALIAGREAEAVELVTYHLKCSESSVKNQMSKEE